MLCSPSLAGPWPRLQMSLRRYLIHRMQKSGLCGSRLIVDELKLYTVPSKSSKLQIRAQTAASRVAIPPPPRVIAGAPASINESVNQFPCRAYELQWYFAAALHLTLNRKFTVRPDEYMPDQVFTTDRRWFPGRRRTRRGQLNQSSRAEESCVDLSQHDLRALETLATLQGFQGRFFSSAFRSRSFISSKI